MLELRTEIVINAIPEKIWDVLTDFANYPNWNPFITKVVGTAKLGEMLSVSITPPGKKTMTFSSKLMEVNQNCEMRWVGKVLGGKVFRGEHYFLLDPISATQTKFIHGEVFTGLMLPIMKKDLKGAAHKGFIEMNEALAKRCGGSL